MATQTIELVMRDRNLAFKEGSERGFLVSQNDCYQMHIDLDETRNAMFATFFRNGKAVKTRIDGEGFVLHEVSQGQYERGVPVWALTAPMMKVGVEADKYSSTTVDCFVKYSIKDFYEGEDVAPDDPLIEQLIALVNSIGQDGGGVAFTTDQTLTLDENHVLRVNTTNNTEEDNTLPITSAGVFTQVGNINALLETI